MSRPHKVRVIYKSGATVDVECDEFTTKRDRLKGLVSVEWKNASPEPMHFGVDDVAAIWRIR